MTDQEKYDQVKDNVDKALEGLAILLSLAKPAEPEPSAFEKAAFEAVKKYWSRDYSCLAGFREKCSSTYAMILFMWNAGHKKRGEDDVETIQRGWVCLDSHLELQVEAIRKNDQEQENGN